MNINDFAGDWLRSTTTTHSIHWFPNLVRRIMKIINCNNTSKQQAIKVFLIIFPGTLIDVTYLEYRIQNSDYNFSIQQQQEEDMKWIIDNDYKFKRFKISSWSLLRWEEGWQQFWKKVKVQYTKHQQRWLTEPANSSCL